MNIYQKMSILFWQAFYGADRPVIGTGRFTGGISSLFRDLSSLHIENLLFPFQLRLAFSTETLSLGLTGQLVPGFGFSLL